MVQISFGLRSQLQDWHARGLIDNELLKRLERDIEAHKSKRSFSSIAVVLGVICLCFGAMSFVAANWEEMPRVTRLLILLTAIAISYLLAAQFAKRDMKTFAHSFVLLGCGCFGATVMLVGQMYHLPGHASGAMLLWSLGTLAAAILVRSVPALVLATLLATLWSCWLMEDRSEADGIHYWFLIFWALCAGLAWLLKSRLSAHVAALCLQVWVLFTIFDTSKEHVFPIVAASFIVIALVSISFFIWSKESKELLRGFELSAIFHLSLFTIVQMVLWYGAQFDRDWYRGETVLDIFTTTAMGVLLPLTLLLSLIFWFFGNGKGKFDHVVCSALIGLTGIVLCLSAIGFPFVLEGFSLVLTIWMIRMGTRQESPSITRLGYVGFIGAMLLIYAEAAGGLLGTSLFYIVAGVLLVAGALLAPRISRSKRELPQ
ncbi:MAG: DUF2157 domain-containing protein [Pseudomonadota bacterium]